MAGQCRPWRLASLFFLLGLFFTGCNFSALPYFLGFGDDAIPPRGSMRLADENDRKKEVKVVILAYPNQEMQPEFVTVDRELSGQLTRTLQANCKQNKEKITIISANKVQDYKNRNPDWHTMKLQDIGKHFDVDYVIFLGIESMSLYEPGSANQLYRGRAQITVELLNVNKPDDDPIEDHFSCEYPAARGPIAVEDQNAREFYLGFLNFMAKHLSWYFTAHQPADATCE